MRVFRRPRLLLVITFVGGGLAGLAAVVAAEQVNRLTSTEAFCSGTCHSMAAHIAADEAYKSSAHRMAKSGVVATCADCHLPRGLVAETWAHITAGIRDVYSELTHDFEKPEEWEAIRAELAYRVRDRMLADDSASCRTCHELDAIQPSRKRGERQHAEAKETGTTCILCHYNLVHAEVEPREAFLDAAERGEDE